MIRYCAAALNYKKNSVGCCTLHCLTPREVYHTNSVVSILYHTSESKNAVPQTHRGIN